MFVASPVKWVIYNILINIKYPRALGDFFLCTTRPHLEVAESSIKRRSPRYHQPTNPSMRM